jgi:hypothetical protein
VIDVAAQGEEPLIAVRDIGLDLLWRHARVERGNDNNWNLDGGKEIDRHTNNGCHTNDHDNQARHQNEKWISDRKR